MAQATGRKEAAGGRAGRGWLPGVMAVGITLAVLLGIVYWLDMESKRQSAEAQVEILQVRRDRWYDSGDEEYREGYRIHYRFSAGARAYEGLSTRNEWYEPGDAVKACYDPERPEDAELRSIGFTCGSTLLF